ncbi:hypothetical protein HPO_08534 [Hyphomonas polymorpha PS728]|uniref:Uncharacterized protein n=1 Tax=Hyphomonas polymorpha PS728 TaxID=1280954 RepID=A0A062VK37_9PROT|nr:hypothetical protein [Hyphomonas polymorpha]KCZ98933.1 hypothetical protein HPO_08534 [Hyphomonas polymorpha PS728]
MMSIARLSKEPALAEYFALVHPFFWWVFVWQMWIAAKHVQAAGRTGALIRISWWGRVRIEYLGDQRPDPSAYRPAEPTRKAWDDPSWSSAIPIDLLPKARLLFCPRTRGGSGRALSALTKGACALSATADTS